MAADLAPSAETRDLRSTDLILQTVSKCVDMYSLLLSDDEDEILIGFGQTDLIKGYFKHIILKRNLI